MGLYIAAIMVSKISIIFFTIKNPAEYNITVTLQAHNYGVVKYKTTQAIT